MLSDDPKAKRAIEVEFMRWANAFGIVEKHRTMKFACCGDGEAFGALINNPRVQAPEQLDLILIEADQVTAPSVRWEQPTTMMGFSLIRFAILISIMS